MASQSFDLRAAEAGREPPEILFGRASRLAAGSHPLKRDDAQVGRVLRHRVARVLVEEAQRKRSPPGGCRRRAAPPTRLESRRADRARPTAGSGDGRSSRAGRDGGGRCSSTRVLARLAGADRRRRHRTHGSGVQTSPAPMSTAGRPRRRSTTLPSSTATRVVLRVVGAHGEGRADVLELAVGEPDQHAVALQPRDRHGSAGTRAGA